jgi:hypothetical protein
VNVRETELDIPNGNITIKALLTGGWGNTLFIQMHSYTWDMRRAIHDRAAQFFNQVELPYLRFNLYDTRDGTRNLSDPLTIEDHVSDLRAVIAYTRGRGVKEVHVGGYSLSAYPLVVAASDPLLKIQSAVFWDGSHPTQPPLEASNYLHWKERGLYVSSRGAGAAVSEAYFKSVQAFKANDYTEAWKTPALLLVAGAGPLKDAATIYQKLFHPHVKRVDVEGANHQFTAMAWIDQLCQETRDWVMGGYRKV